MRANVIDTKAYWALRKPYDRYLPDSIPAEDVEAELEIIEKRFRDRIEPLGDEGEDWEFPGHYQHVRVFYVYLHSPSLYTPTLAVAVSAALAGFESWIGELECNSVPGTAEPHMLYPVFLKGEFYLDAGDNPSGFAEALELEVINSVRPKPFWRRLFC